MLCDKKSHKFSPYRSTSFSYSWVYGHLGWQCFKLLYTLRWSVSSQQKFSAWQNHKKNKQILRKLLKAWAQNWPSETSSCMSWSKSSRRTNIPVYKVCHQKHIRLGEFEWQKFIPSQFQNQGAAGLVSSKISLLGLWMAARIFPVSL